VKNSHGWTPFQVAIIFGRMELVPLLSQSDKTGIDKKIDEALLKKGKEEYMSE